MKLKDWIAENGLRQTYIAKKLKISDPHLSKIVNSYHYPEIKLAIDIVRFTRGGVTFADIFDLKEEEVFYKPSTPIN